MKKLIYGTALIVFSLSALANPDADRKYYTHPVSCLEDSSLKKASKEENFFVFKGACYDARSFCFDGELVVRKGGLDRNGKKTCSGNFHTPLDNLFWQ